MTDAPPSQPTPEDDPRLLDRQMVRWTRVVGLFTALLFIANAVGLFFIWEQWRVANKSQVDTREQLMAAVGFQGINEALIGDKDGKVISYAFQPQFNNAGGTRTASFRPWFSVQYFDKEVPNNLDFSKPYSRFEISDSMLPANGISNIETAAIGAEYVEKIKNQVGVGIIWGRADWSEIFDPSQIHTVSFCFKLEPIVAGDGKIFIKPISYKPECNYSK